MEIRAVDVNRDEVHITIVADHVNALVADPREQDGTRRVRGVPTHRAFGNADGLPVRTHLVAPLGRRTLVDAHGAPGAMAVYRGHLTRAPDQGEGREPPLRACTQHVTTVAGRAALALGRGQEVTPAEERGEGVHGPRPHSRVAGRLVHGRGAVG